MRRFGHRGRLDQYVAGSGPDMQPAAGDDGDLVAQVPSPGHGRESPDEPDGCDPVQERLVEMLA
jgi:hypothetical protein